MYERNEEAIMRKNLLIATAFAAILTLPVVASAQETMTGAAGGAVAGAVVGGPVGAVVGGAIGGTVGAAAESERRDAQGRVIVEERAVVAPPVSERTCVDNGVTKTCTEVHR
jgi:hypothetical protein